MVENLTIGVLTWEGWRDLSCIAAFSRIYAVLLFGAVLLRTIAYRCWLELYYSFFTQNFNVSQT
jgi:hypothetical protein